MDIEKDEVEVEQPEVAENQIGFDFLKTPLDQALEDAAKQKAEESEDEASTQTETQPSAKWDQNRTLVVVFQAKDAPISDQFDICGKKMIDWVLMASSGCEQKILPQVPEEKLLETLKDLADGFSYVVALFSNTPLLQKATFCEIMQHFVAQNLNAMKLKHGYVFKAEFLQTARMLLSTAQSQIGEDEFVQVDSARTLSQAFEVLNCRILDFHAANGVVFFGKNTIFVDADVEIEAGALIYGNNVIKGQSFIGSGAILESGNFILDSVVCEGAFVCQSYLEKCKISQGKTVGPFEKIVGRQV